MSDNKDNREQGPRPACAACKFQRKKCQPDCILWKHFPADKSEEFLAVHQVFGVKNVSNMLKHAVDKDEVATSLSWEAEVWVQEPEQGPYGLYKRIEERCRMLEQELEDYKRKQQLQQDLQAMEFRPVVPELAGVHHRRINGVFDGSNLGTCGTDPIVNGYNNLLPGTQETGGIGIFIHSFPSIGRMEASQPLIQPRFLENYQRESNGLEANMFPNYAISRFDHEEPGYIRGPGGGGQVMKRENLGSCPNSAPGSSRTRRKRDVNGRDLSGNSASYLGPEINSQDSNYSDASHT